MDPVSQGIIGSAFAQSFSHKISVRLAALLGLLGGMAPDLDVLIRSKSDPLLALEFHRQFTHSLIFIPFGALIVASLFYFVFGRRIKVPFKLIYFYCFLGYATHALLDACTSYGTQLFWPFTNYRISWNNISIVDPLFTLPLIILVVMSVFRRKPIFAKTALVWAVTYLLVGVVQNQRALSFSAELAESRGHIPLRHTAKPSLGNLIVWKSIYEYEGRYYVDAVHVSTKKKVYAGDSVRKLDIKRDFPELNMMSQQAKDIERFRWFSDDFIVVDKDDKNLVGDMRYSMLPNQIKSLWGIQVRPNNKSEDSHVGYKMVSSEQRGNSFGKLWKMILGSDI